MPKNLTACGFAALLAFASPAAADTDLNSCLLPDGTQARIVESARVFFAGVPQEAQTTIEINSPRFKKFPPLSLHFARLHECGHIQSDHWTKMKAAETLKDNAKGAQQDLQQKAFYRLRRESELEADRYAALRLKHAGYEAHEISAATHAVFKALNLPKKDNEKYPTLQARLKTVNDALGIK